MCKFTPRHIPQSMRSNCIQRTKPVSIDRILDSKMSTWPSQAKRFPVEQPPITRDEWVRTRDSEGGGFETG